MWRVGMAPGSAGSTVPHTMRISDDRLPRIGLVCQPPLTARYARAPSRVRPRTSVSHPERTAQGKLDSSLPVIGADTLASMGARQGEGQRTIGLIDAAPERELQHGTVGRITDKGVGQTSRTTVEWPARRHAPLTITRPAQVLDGRAQPGIDDQEAHQPSFP